jgi:GTP-binding protein EngB required for normal cell division
MGKISKVETKLNDKISLINTKMDKLVDQKTSEAIEQLEHKINGRLDEIVRMVGALTKAKAGNGEVEGEEIGEVGHQD